MNKILITDYKLLKETLELTGLNAKQVELVLRKLEYAVDNAVRAASSNV